MTDQLKHDLSRVGARAAEIVKDNIFPFWRNIARDHTRGGFAGLVKADNNPDFLAKRSLVHSSRLVWAFSRGYRAFKSGPARELAGHAYAYFTKHFFDRANGGLYWMIDCDGKPLNRHKQVYGQAFGIYALSEYYLAFGETHALALALDLFACLQRHCADLHNGGYWEARGEFWEQIDDVRLSDKDLNEKKSNNTHLHVLEALTNLLRAKGDDGDVRSALAAVIEVFMEKIYDRRTNHFVLFQDESWNSRCETVSFGHEIEAAWLLSEALCVLGDTNAGEKYRDDMLNISHNALDNYLDGDSGNGGMFNESLHGRIDVQKIWWVQNEAAIGFLNAYELEADERFLRAAVNVWDFCDRAMIDHEGGEWFEVPGCRLPKVHEWKSCYHNTRMCVELFERCERLLARENR